MEGQQGISGQSITQSSYASVMGWLEAQNTSGKDIHIVIVWSEEDAKILQAHKRKWLAKTFQVFMRKCLRGM